MKIQRNWRNGLSLVLLLFLFSSVIQPGPLQGASAPLTEFPLPTAGNQPSDIVAGPDGNLWFTEVAGNKIGRITSRGIIKEFAIPTVNSQPLGITVGPDGNLWFAERSGNRIGRITPSGSITEFAIPTANSFPYDIAAGSDGNLWFIEFSGNKIGRITPGGTITEFTVPTTSSRPFAITLGPDGNLWFAEDGASKIGRISPAGAITEFPLPTATRIWGITAGPDGNIWFTELDANQIGRITSGGAVTEFPVPTPAADVNAITAGPDGNLWFTELALAGNKIGRITPGGVVTEFAIPTPGSGPEGIAVGPDGALWFAESTGNKIGRLAPPLEPAISLLPSAAAPGADLHLSGYNLLPGTAYTIAVGDRAGVMLGQATSDERGRIAATFKLPDLAPGSYRVVATASGATAASTALTVIAPPALSLVPAAGPPGTVVNASVANLVPGSLRLDYAGVPVLGPVPSRGTSWSGSFVVPGDRPSPPGAATTITAINLVSGNVVGVSAPASFQSQPAPARQRPVLRDVRIPTTPLKPGESATMSGKLEVGSSAQLAQHQVLALWKVEGSPPVPLRRKQFALKDDGAFELTVEMPSLLKGDALPAQTGGMIGLVAVGPFDKAYQETPIQVQDTRLYAQPQVRVLRESDKSLILGATIKRTYLATQQIRIDGNKILPVIQAFETYGDLSWLTVKPNELAEHIWAMANVCEIQAEDPLRELWADPHEKVVLPQKFELPANGIQLTSPIVAPGVLGTQAAPEVLEAEVWHVEVDASKQGYGRVDEQGVYTKYSEVFVVIPSKNRAFQLSMSENDGLTAAEVPYPPIQVVLPKLPPNFKSVNILQIEANGPHDGEQGHLHTLRNLNLPPQAISTTPLTFTLLLERTSDVSLAIPTFRWDGVALQPEAPQELLFNPPPGKDPCQKPGGVPEPPRNGTLYSVTIPNAHLQTPGDHTLSYSFSGGLGVEGKLVFHYQDDVPNWITSAGYTNQSVKWSPQSVTLSANRPPRIDAAVSTSANETPNTGPIRNEARAGCIGVRQSLGTTGPTFPRVGGTRGGAALNGYTELPFGDVKCSTSTAATIPGATTQNAEGAIPLFGPETTSVVPHIEFTMPDLDIGIPFVLTVGFGASLWFEADVTSQGELLLDQNGAPADVVLTVTPSGESGGEMHINGKALGGLLAKAQVKVTAVTNLSMPVTFRNDGVDSSGSSFRYHIYLTVSGGTLCDPIGIFGGGCAVGDSEDYDIIGPNCKGACGQVVQSARPQAEAPAPAYAEPAIATDGLGNTFALWRAASNRLAFSRYLNGAWSAPSTLPTGLGAFSPKLAFVAPNRAVAVWVESSLSEAQARSVSFEDAIKSQHIAYALWDGSAWGQAQALTTPSLGEGRVALAGCLQGALACPAGGQVTAVWERNVAADFSKRQIRLFYSVYRTGVWSASQPVDPSAGILAATDAQAEVAYRQGAPFVVWVRDADHDPKTLGDRRITTLLLGADDTIKTPVELPDRIAEIALAVKSDGTPHIAFTRIEPNAQLIDTRHSLYNASTTGGGWTFQQLRSNDRPIYAEQPVLTLDASGKGTITFRGLGFGPNRSGQFQAYPEDALGMLARTGELSQVETDFLSAAHTPHYLTNDGAVNWQPAAVYDPATNSTIALAVTGPKPVIPRDMQVQRAPESAISSQVAADQPIVFASAPRLPDFVVAAITPSAQFPQPGQRLSVTAQLRNDGVAWQSDGEQALDVVATWDGAPGVGEQAGRTQLARLAAGQTTNVTLSLTPPAPLDRPHTLVVTVNPQQRIAEPNALDNQQSAQVGGIPAPLNVQAASKRGVAKALLDWEAPADPRVVGYRIYRLDDRGAQTPMGSSFITGFVDRNVQFDQTYRYVVTAYTADGLESAPSAPVTVSLSRIQVFMPIVAR